MNMSIEFNQKQLEKESSKMLKYVSALLSRMGDLTLGNGYRVLTFSIAKFSSWPTQEKRRRTVIMK